MTTNTNVVYIGTFPDGSQLLLRRWYDEDGHEHLERDMSDLMHVDDDWPSDDAEAFDAFEAAADDCPPHGIRREVTS